ncbi:MAG TPA: hypothetical protein VHO25_08680, partial [Polyangiaceae bacterium]|nr:hypothetical protein [Polyangiaceae bacterium]
RGSTTTAWFRYAATDPGACDDSFGTATTTATYTGGTTGLFYLSTGPLLPNVTYYYCTIASNVYGTSFGSVVSFTTPLGAPSANTDAATVITGTQAQFNGSANPAGYPTTAWFRYSTSSTCNDSVGTRVPATGGTDIGSGTTDVPFSFSTNSLTRGTTYYFCAIAENSMGKRWGSAQSFTTWSWPTVATQAATNMANTSATLNGSATPNQVATTGWFRVDIFAPANCNDTFGVRYPSSGGTDLGAGTSSVPFTYNLTGVPAAQIYYYCAIAENSEGKRYGTVQSFATTGAQEVTTNAQTALTATSVTLNGSVNLTGVSTTVGFRYGTTNPGTCDDSFGVLTSATSFTSQLGYYNFNRSVTGLTPVTTYYYCARSTNTYGVGLGSVRSFTTPAAAPTTTTTAATLVTSTAAQLNGTSNPGGGSTTAWFRYDTVSPGTCNDTFGTRAPASSGTNVGVGTSSVPFAESLTGLAPSTTYYFCAISQNGAGKTFGSVLSFITPIPPTAVTNAATSLNDDSATLNGSGIPNQGATTGWFRYSTTDPVTCNDSFGTRAPVSGGTALGAGVTSVAFSQPLSNVLLPATTYYFCAITENSAGKTFGSVLSFRTRGPPTVTTSAQTSLNARS